MAHNYNYLKVDFSEVTFFKRQKNKILWIFVRKQDDVNIIKSF